MILEGLAVDKQTLTVPYRLSTIEQDRCKSVCGAERMH